jgi:hypothetical protein
MKGVPMNHDIGQYWSPRKNTVNRQIGFRNNCLRRVTYKVRNCTFCNL